LLRFRSGTSYHGFGVWCAARRLNVGSFEWPRHSTDGMSVKLTVEQFDALVLGLPWQRLEQLRM
jgi:transposase